MSNVRQQLREDREELHRLYAARALALNTEFEQAARNSEYAQVRATAQQLIRQCPFIDINGALLALIDRAAEAMKPDDD